MTWGVCLSLSRLALKFWQQREWRGLPGDPALATPQPHTDRPCARAHHWGHSPVPAPQTPYVGTVVRFKPLSLGVTCYTALNIYYRRRGAWGAGPALTSCIRWCSPGICTARPGGHPPSTPLFPLRQPPASSLLQSSRPQLRRLPKPPSKSGLRSAALLPLHQQPRCPTPPGPRLCCTAGDLRPRRRQDLPQTGDQGSCPTAPGCFSSNSLWAPCAPGFSPDSASHCCHSPVRTARGTAGLDGPCQRSWLQRTLHLSGHKFAFRIQEAPIPSMSNVINYSKPSATVFKRSIKGFVHTEHTATSPLRHAQSWGWTPGDPARAALRGESSFPDVPE